jgi:hypothetical protein
MYRFQKSVFSTETGSAIPPSLTASIRSGSVDETSPTVCNDYTVSVNCRVDTSGNASPIIFEVGNTVYNNLSGTTKFNGNNLYYMIQASISADDSYICQVNTLGVITDITTNCPIIP